MGFIEAGFCVNDEHFEKGKVRYDRNSPGAKAGRAARMAEGKALVAQIEANKKKIQQEQQKKGTPKRETPIRHTETVSPPVEEETSPRPAYVDTVPDGSSAAVVPESTPKTEPYNNSEMAYWGDLWRENGYTGQVAPSEPKEEEPAIEIPEVEPPTKEELEGYGKEWTKGKVPDGRQWTRRMGGVDISITPYDARRIHGVSPKSGLGLPNGFSEDIPTMSGRRDAAERLVYDMDTFLSAHGNERKTDRYGPVGTRDEMRAEIMSMLKDPAGYKAMIERIPAPQRTLDQRQLRSFADMADNYQRYYGVRLHTDIGLDVNDAKDVPKVKPRQRGTPDGYVDNEPRKVTLLGAHPGNVTKVVNNYLRGGGHTSFGLARSYTLDSLTKTVDGLKAILDKDGDTDIAGSMGYRYRYRTEDGDKKIARTKLNTAIARSLIKVLVNEGYPFERMENIINHNLGKAGSELMTVHDLLRDPDTGEELDAITLRSHKGQVGHERGNLTRIMRGENGRYANRFTPSEEDMRSIDDMFNVNSKVHGGNYFYYDGGKDDKGNGIGHIRQYIDPKAPVDLGALRRDIKGMSKTMELIMGNVDELLRYPEEPDSLISRYVEMTNHNNAFYGEPLISASDIIKELKEARERYKPIKSALEAYSKLYNRPNGAIYFTDGKWVARLKGGARELDLGSVDPASLGPKDILDLIDKGKIRYKRETAPEEPPTANEVKPEEVKPEEVKPEEVKPEETKPPDKTKPIFSPKLGVEGPGFKSLDRGLKKIAAVVNEVGPQIPDGSYLLGEEGKKRKFTLNQVKRSGLKIYTRAYLSKKGGVYYITLKEGGKGPGEERVLSLKDFEGIVNAYANDERAKSGINYPSLWSYVKEVLDAKKKDTHKKASWISAPFFVTDTYFTT